MINMYKLTFFKWDGLNEWLTPICSDCLIKKSHVLYIYVYIQCVCVCVRTLRIVSRDKIMRFKNTFIIVVINIIIKYYITIFEDDACV